MGKGSKMQFVNDAEIVIYYVDFAVKKESVPSKQNYFGQLHFESPEAFHYKVKQEYTIVVTDLVLAEAGDFKSVMN